MSFNGGQGASFFGPLRGKTTTFLLEGRQGNLDFARTMMGYLAQSKGCAILDLDAFYSSNADRVLSLLGEEAARSTLVRVPDPGCEVEAEFSKLFDLGHDVVIMDSLNSLYHLMSQQDGTSTTRKLTFAVAGLSYLARANQKAVIMTMYKREGFGRSGTGRSISGLSDSTASVDTYSGKLVLRMERGSAWPGGVFSTRIP